MNKQAAALRTSITKAVTSPRLGLLWAAVLLVAAVAVMPFYAWPVSAQSNSPPDRPARPTAVAVSHDSVTISWADPGDSSITGYQILRRNRETDAEGDLTIIEDDTGTSATTYTDDTVAPSTRYFYRVKARNAHGLSKRSKYVRATTPAQPTPDPAPTAVTLSLNPDSVSESAAATPVTVTASLNNSPLPTATEVTVSVAGGTATSATDYAAVSAFTVTVQAGQSSGTAELSFEPTQDNLAEGNETVTLSGSAAGLTAGAATLTITDGDVTIVPRTPFLIRFRPSSKMETPRTTIPPTPAPVAVLRLGNRSEGSWTSSTIATGSPWNWKRTTPTM